MADDSGYGWIFFAAIIWILVPVFFLYFTGYFGIETASYSGVPETFDLMIDGVQTSVNNAISSIPLIGSALGNYITPIIMFPFKLFQFVFGTLIDLVYPVVNFSLGFSSAITNTFGFPAWLGVLFMSIWMLIPFYIFFKEFIMPIIQGMVT